MTARRTKLPLTRWNVLRFDPTGEDCSSAQQLHSDRHQSRLTKPDRSRIITTTHFPPRAKGKRTSKMSVARGLPDLLGICYNFESSKSYCRGATTVGFGCTYSVRQRRYCHSDFNPCFGSLSSSAAIHLPSILLGKFIQTFICSEARRLL